VDDRGCLKSAFVFSMHLVNDAFECVPASFTYTPSNRSFMLPNYVSALKNHTKGVLKSEAFNPLYYNFLGLPLRTPYTSLKAFRTAVSKVLIPSSDLRSNLSKNVVVKVMQNRIASEVPLTLIALLISSTLS